MTTIGEAVDRCYRTWLYGTYERDRNQLANPLGVNDDTLTLKYAKEGAASGGLIAIGDEILAVVDTAANGQDLQVIRGVDGTSARAYPAGRAVEINPRYARGTIVDEMYHELVSWPEDVYPTATTRIIAERGISAFEVTGIPSDARIRRILDVQRTARSIRDQRGFRVAWRAAYDVNHDGDVWINLDEDGCGATYRVVVATDWPVTPEQWVEDLDLVAELKMSHAMVDALVLGAVWRIVFAKEGRKLQLEAQGQSRDPQEIPAGALANFGLRLLSLRDRRLMDERERLVGRWGFG